MTRPPVPEEEEEEEAEERRDAAWSRREKLVAGESEQMSVAE